MAVGTWRGRLERDLEGLFRGKRNKHKSASRSANGASAHLADQLHRSVCRSQLIVAWYSWSDLTSPFPLMAASMPSAAA